MRRIDDGDTIRELNVADLIAEFQIDVRDLDSDDIDDTEYQLITNQYAYVKFGLILEKIRTRAWWVKCVEKFQDFRAFCQAKVNLNIWQASNAIKSAQVAVRLAYLGFTELPRNASQALKMSDLSIERLAEVWSNVIKSCEGHKITALAIESQINPDKPVTSSTLRLPAAVIDGLTRQAIERGLTLNEYLERLANGEDLDDEPVESNPQPVDAEMSKTIDALDRKFRSIDNRPNPLDLLDRFDELMNGLIGRVPPPPRARRVA
jgi:hypothetical protein